MAPNKLLDKKETNDVEILKKEIESLREENETAKTQYIDAMKELNILRKQDKKLTEEKEEIAAVDGKAKVHKFDASLGTFSGIEDVNNFIYVADISLENAGIPPEKQLKHLTPRFTEAALE